MKNERSLWLNDRKRYRREYYHCNREKLRAQQTECARIKRGDPPADKPVKPIFLLLALLKWYRDRCAWRRAYRARNREQLLTQEKDRFLKNADSERARKAAYARKWRARHPKEKAQRILLSKEEKQQKRRDYARGYRNQNRDKINAIRTKSFHKRKAENPAIKIVHSVRVRMNDALRGKYKSDTTLKLIGCSPRELVSHLESKFTEGMNWKNHGHGSCKWVIDHIIPCASFDLSDPEQQRKCFHYSNLAPVWFIANCEKSSRHGGKFHRFPKPCPTTTPPLS